MATVAHSNTQGHSESLDPSAVLLDMASGWVLPGDDEAEGYEESFLAEDDGPRFTLAGLADQEAASYRAWGNPVGDLFARHMDELAEKIRLIDATTPQEYEAQIEVYEDDIRGRWEARGYDAGLEASRNTCRCGKALYD